MPRVRRNDQPGEIYHLIARGVNRQRIFIDRTDWFFFQKGLVRAYRYDDLGILAFVLMPNHIHLVARRGREPLGTAMRRLLGSHAMRFNRKYGRCGHLFQNRFKSKPCKTDEYLIHLVRYVHANPVRAGLVAHAGDYRYSSRWWYTRPRAPRWADTGIVDALMGTRARTRSFFEHSDDEADRAVIVGAEEQPLATAPAVAVDTLPVLQRARPSASLESLSAHCQDRYGVSVAELRSRTKRPNVVEARRQLAIVAVRDHRVSQAEVARFLGLDPARVSRYLARRQRA